MVKYCRKCGAEIELDDEFCGKCGERIAQKYVLMDKKRNIIQSFYLALGSIALFLAFRYFMASSMDLFGYYVSYLIYSFLLFPTSILLILTYHGFIYSKKYPKFTGIVGGILLLIFCVYYILDNLGLEYLEYKIAEICLLIADIVLLISTIIFWKKLT